MVEAWQTVCSHCGFTACTNVQVFIMLWMHLLEWIFMMPIHVMWSSRNHEQQERSISPEIAKMFWCTQPVRCLWQQIAQCLYRCCSWHDDDDKVTCDTAEKIGHSIMLSMDNKAFADTVMKKSSQVRTLSEVTKKVKTGSNPIKLWLIPTLCLLVCWLSWHTLSCRMSCFQYKLTSVPTALFRDSVLRKTEKPALAKEITRQVDTATQVPSTDMYVLDGGCLLHHVVWPKCAKYCDVINAYLN